jgi:signal peptidase I
MRVIFTIIFSIWIWIVVFAILFGLKKAYLESKEKLAQELRCVSSIEEKFVEGNSLVGLIESGEKVKILFGYYDCNGVKRNDLIVYSYGGNENLLIKIAKGLPGDKFSLQKTEGGWHILINGEVLKNSENKPYLLDEKSYRMLSLYERDYKGVIPENAYLILGNLVSGTLDSTSFGLVGKQDILGKAIKKWSKNSTRFMLKKGI